MRVLTTNMYFERDQINFDTSVDSRPRRGGRGREDDADFGIGIGWFAGDTTEMMDPIDKPNPNTPNTRRRDDEPLNVDVLSHYLDLFLLDADEFSFNREGRSLKNESIIEYVLSQPFVIERSPPIHVTLKGLITATNLPVWIGTYMGWHAIPEPSVLLFITVPGGIIVVSSAVGLANALGAGLSKSVKRLFKIR